MTHIEKIGNSFLAMADIKIGGTRPWDVQIHNDRVYQRVLSGHSLGLGESYMDGWWDTPALDQFFDKLLSAGLDRRVKQNPRLLLSLAIQKAFNPQRQSKAFEVAEKHYDLDNDLFEKMLDRRMVYTCGYWKNATTLEDAQVAKMDLVCRKLDLQPGMKVLDIGCGFGSFAKYAAQQYGVSVVGISVSKEQLKYAKNSCAGLPITFQFKDYRDLTGLFDRIASIGMVEAVGSGNLRTFMQTASDHLKEDGLFLLHTIGANDSSATTDYWLNKYIFPNGEVPSRPALAKAADGIFIEEDMHNFGADYDRTLMSWFQNFDNNWPSLSDRYDQRFYRMWKYYFLMCAGSFRARTNHLWQIVYSKHGVRGGYRPIR